MKTHTRFQDVARSLGWRVSRDPYWNWHKKDEAPSFYFDPSGDEWCIRRDGRTDLPCNEALPSFLDYDFGTA
jgi:hypothetical protein